MITFTILMLFHKIENQFKKEYRPCQTLELMKIIKCFKMILLKSLIFNL